MSRQRFDHPDNDNARKEDMFDVTVQTRIGVADTALAAFSVIMQRVSEGVTSSLPTSYQFTCDGRTYTVGVKTAK